jgi:hypothetical protein
MRCFVLDTDYTPSSLETLTWKLSHIGKEPDGRHENSWRGIIFVHNIRRFIEPIFVPRHSAVIQLVSVLMLIKYVCVCLWENFLSWYNLVTVGIWNFGITAEKTNTYTEVSLKKQLNVEGKNRYKYMVFHYTHMFRHICANVRGFIHQTQK